MTRESGAVSKETVTVGTDGSYWGETALQWAARHAWLRDVELVVLRANDSTALRQITRGLPLLPLRVRDVADAPLAALAHASAASALLVVGCRGQGRRTLGLGKLVLPVVRASRCSTLVVRGAPDAVHGKHHRVTAMVGWADDVAVVRHAANMALTRGAELRITHADPLPVTAHPAPYEHDPDAVLAAARAQLAVLDRQLSTVVEVVRAQPHEVVATCTDSDLIVVGAGSRTTGCVTKAALYHAPCPVMIAQGLPVTTEQPTALGRATWSPCLPWPRQGSPAGAMSGQRS